MDWLDESIPTMCLGVFESIDECVKMVTVGIAVALLSISINIQYSSDSAFYPATMSMMHVIMGTVDIRN